MANSSWILLFGGFAQRALAAGLDVACRRHLRFEVRVIGREFDAALGIAHRKHVALRCAKPRKQFLGQDDGGAVTDLGDLERRVHTLVITSPLKIFKNGYSAVFSVLAFALLLLALGGAETISRSKSGVSGKRGS